MADRDAVDEQSSTIQGHPSVIYLHTPPPEISATRLVTLAEYPCGRVSIPYFHLTRPAALTPPPPVNPSLPGLPSSPPPYLLHLPLIEAQLFTHQRYLKKLGRLPLLVMPRGRPVSHQLSRTFILFPNVCNGRLEATVPNANSSTCRFPLPLSIFF
jgi:hypothetical protein